MSKNDFKQLYAELTKIHEQFMDTISSEELLRKASSYQSCLKQLTQILSAIDDKESLLEDIENVESMNRDLEAKLMSEKDDIHSDIRRNSCREHIRKKYVAKDGKSSLINRKF